MADMVIVRSYGEHSSPGKPGPLAGGGWFRQQLDIIAGMIPRSKTIMALGTYGVDWDMSGGGRPKTMGFHTTMRLAQERGSDIGWDKSSLNHTFWYQSRDGGKHEVWLLDGTAVWNQYRDVRQKKLSGISLVHTGDEDASVWGFISPGSLDSFEPKSLAILPTPSHTVTTGSGKFFRVSYLGKDGERELTLSGKTITDSKYIHLPQSPTISRFSPGKPKTIALVFYGGPGAYTEQVLDVLKNHQVRSTFFPVAEHMETYALVVDRMYSEGHLLGNSLSQKGVDQVMEKNE